MNKNKYSIYIPLKYTQKTKFFGHSVYIYKKEKTYVPDSFSKKNINPENFLNLKNKFSINNILIFDKVKPFTKKTCIVGHVNRSGFNFLINSTPIKNLPMFPDMSKIYIPLKGFKKIKVHTLGPKRFNSGTLIDEVSSETSGLISPLWHYVGVKVSAVAF